MSDVFKQFDAVRLLVAVPNADGIRPGMVGALLDVSTHIGPSSEVGHLATLALRPEQIELVWTRDTAP